MTLEELKREKLILINELAEINIRNKFCPIEERPASDETRFREIVEQMRKLDDGYDREHPVANCPECWHERYASLDGDCINFGECKTAGYPGG